MSCKSRLDDLLFGTGGNSITEITKNAKLFAAEAVSEWPKIVTRIYKERSQKIIDFIRAKAPWLPGGQHGDDIGTVLDDDEYARFQAVCDTITKRFAEDGKYTRYIDAEELSLYFRDNPLFFKEGYTQAIMDTTGHVRDHAFDPTFVGDHITKFTATDATTRRTQWHAFIDDLQQGLIDEFGEVRGKKLADDLGLTAAKDAHEINAIIFKWGKSMWDNAYNGAKNFGATDEEARLFAEISASGVCSGNYPGTAPVNRGVPGWIKRHPWWSRAIATIGIFTSVRLLVWWWMDNFPFHIWMLRYAGVLDKTYGAQANEVTARLDKMGYVFRDFPCDTQAQQDYVDMLVELKRLKELADTVDPIPEDKINRYITLTKIVYGVDIGDPNAYERKMVNNEYSSYTNEYNLRIKEEQCDMDTAIVPPDGWAEVTTGTLLVTATVGGFSVYLDEAAAASCTTYGKDDKDCEILNVQIGEHIIEVRKEGCTSCKEAITITAEANAYRCDLIATECPDIEQVKISAAPSMVKVGVDVEFTATITSVRPITSVEFDFGNGVKKTPAGGATTIKYAYPDAGTFQASATAFNDCRKSAITYSLAKVIVTEEEPPYVPPEEESATIDVLIPKDSQTNKSIVWPVKVFIFVDGQAIGKEARYAIPFGGFGELPVKDPTVVTVKAVGYQDKSKTFHLCDGFSEEWQPYMDPVGYVPPVGKFPIDFYIPDGASLTTTKLTTVSRLITGMRRIGRR